MPINPSNKSFTHSDFQKSGTNASYFEQVVYCSAYSASESSVLHCLSDKDWHVEFDRGLPGSKAFFIIIKIDLLPVNCIKSRLNSVLRDDIYFRYNIVVCLTGFYARSS